MWNTIKKEVTMYKLKRPTDKQLSDFYKSYGLRIQYLMRELVNGNITIPIDLKEVHLILKVQANSPTKQFLIKYSQEANLYKLLCGGWRSHLEIIEDVCQLFPDLSWQNRMLKGKYDRGEYTIYGQNVDGKEIVEDFNEIVYWLFVNQMFEGYDDVAPFLKKRFRY